MKKNILYAAAAGICGAVLLGGGILIGKSLQPPPEKPVELELLFDLDGMRAAAECGATHYQIDDSWRRRRMRD